MNSESRVRKPKPLCSKNTACRATGYPAEGVKKKKKKTLPHTIQKNQFLVA